MEVLIKQILTRFSGGKLANRNLILYLYWLQMDTLHGNEIVPTLIGAQGCGKTYYYEFRNGTRLIHPAIQEEIRSLFRQADWKEDVHFDSYVEDYDW